VKRTNLAAVIAAVLLPFLLHLAAPSTFTARSTAPCSGLALVAGNPSDAAVVGGPATEPIQDLRESGDREDAGGSAGLARASDRGVVR